MVRTRVSCPAMIEPPPPWECPEVPTRPVLKMCIRDSVYRERATWRLAALRDDAESARLFLDQGEVPAEGYRLRQPELATTLQALADHGRAGFYGGELGKRLIAGVRKAGGIWNEDDLAEYRVQWRAPLRFALEDGRELISAPPPSAGGIALAQSLAILQQLPWRRCV